MEVLDANGQYLPYDFSELSERLRLKAKVELHESEDSVREGLRKLKEFIKENNVRSETEDIFLLMFLRCKKYNFKKASLQLTEFSYQRHALMKYYGFMFTDTVMKPIHLNICGLLPKRDEEGRVIIYFRASQFKSDLTHPDDVLRAVQVLGMYALSLPASQVCGLAVIIDMKVPSMDVLHLLLQYARMAIPTLNSFPGRFQKIDLINTNLIIRTFTNLMRPFLPSKLMQRVKFHGSNPKDLLKSYDPSLLPEELGGTLGPISEVSSKSHAKLEAFIPKLQDSNKFYKRPNSVPYPES